MAIILIIKEDNRRHEVTLTGEPFIIGRSRKSNLKINDPKMSSQHCSVKLSGGRVFISDLDSTNGTLINNNKVKSAPLYIDDVVKIGNTTMYLNKKKMTKEEQAIHTSTSRDAVNQRLAQSDETNSRIQKLKEARKARAKQSKAPVPEHIKKKHAIGKKKSDGFAVLTRILKIK